MYTSQFSYKNKIRHFSYPAVTALHISLWSVPASVFRLRLRGFLVRVLLFIVSPSVVWLTSSPCRRDLRCNDILSKLFPEISTATISAGNLEVKIIQYFMYRTEGGFCTFLQYITYRFFLLDIKWNLRCKGVLISRINCC